jgi:hypothetical protein
MAQNNQENLNQNRNQNQNRDQQDRTDKNLGSQSGGGFSDMNQNREGNQGRNMSGGNQTISSETDKSRKEGMSSDTHPGQYRQEQNQDQNRKAV